MPITVPIRKQSRQVTLAFAIGQRVKISELNVSGVVISISLNSGHNRYEVRYFDEAEAREVYFYEWELTEI